MNSMSLENNWDISLNTETGSIARRYGSEQVQQHIKSRLQFFKDEWFLNRQAGVPWFQEHLVKPANIALIESNLKAEILDTEGVESLNAFALDFDSKNRGVSIVFCANLADTVINECMEFTI